MTNGQARGFAVGPATGVIVAGVAALPLAQGTPDERAVAQMIADRQLAWNTGDAEGYRRLLTPDADLSSSSGQITFTGMRVTGHDQQVDAHLGCESCS